jgi:DNA-binding IclR family transcriptional regulator
MVGAALGEEARVRQVSGLEDGVAGQLGSVDNALRLIRYVLERNEVRLSDVADHLGVSKSTAHRLLSTLASRGFVTQTRSRTYLRGRVLANREQATVGRKVQTLIRARLERLCADVGETCSYVVLEGNGIRFIDQITGPAPAVRAKLGILLPAHTNSGGKALLAQLSDEAVEDLYPRGLPKSTGRGPRSVPQLRRELATIRRRGYGINVDEAARGVTAVGRHIRVPHGEVLGAMIIASPSVRTPPARVAQHGEVLMRASADLEASF